MNDNKELNEILKQKSSFDKKVSKGRVRNSIGSVEPDICESPDKDIKRSGLVQWTTNDGKIFIPASKTIKELIPGVYEIKQSSGIGIYFEKIPVKTEGLIRFPQANSDKVIEEIQTFWNQEKMFKKYGLTYKRGIILWGPAGSGKTSTLQIIMKDVVERGGVVIKFTHPGLFLEGMRSFREIQTKTPVIILMEDIDSIMDNYSESDVLNILDGVDKTERVIFLATTNYPDRLGARIINRPSRFDKRFKIGHPDRESREIYFKSLIKDDTIRELNIDLNQWVKDTEHFSIAHLKELFVAVVILGDDYEEAIETLSSMKEIVHPSEYEDHRPMGFGR